MVTSMGEALMTYEELTATGRAHVLSPHELERRFLVKGKVKLPKLKRSEKKTALTRRVSSYLNITKKGLARTGSCTGVIRRKSSGSLKRKNSRSGSGQGITLSGLRRKNLVIEGGRLKGAPQTTMRGTSFDDVLADEMLRETSCTEDRLTTERLTEDALDEDELPATKSRSISAGSIAAEFDLALLQIKARMTLARRNSTGTRSLTNQFYANFLTVRSLPLQKFFGREASEWLIPITSVDEGKLLRMLGLPAADRNHILGLQIGHSSASAQVLGLTEEQLASRALIRLAANPPPQAGWLQRRTSHWLLRPFPAGLRFSGKNMSPLPGWLIGAQSVCLNMSNVDLPVALHFALFKGSGGFVLKPLEMCDSQTTISSRSSQKQLTSRISEAARPKGWDMLRQLASVSDSSADEDIELEWPPARLKLHRTDIKILSLHNLPKRKERRPRRDGSRSECHKFHPELTGAAAPPDNLDPSSPKFTIALHPVGGFCAVTSTLPLRQNAETEITTKVVRGNGMHAAFGDTIYCLAAEPDATFMRISVTDGRQEVAYETAVLGRLRPGYRILQLRDRRHGTRVELCYVLVRISFGSEQQLWATPRQQERQFGVLRKKLDVQRERIRELEEKQQGTKPGSLKCRESDSDHTPRLRVGMLSGASGTSGEDPDAMQRPGGAPFSRAGSQPRELSGAKGMSSGVDLNT